MNYPHESDIEDSLENLRWVLYKELIQDEWLESVLEDYERLTLDLHLNILIA